jgi:transposase
MFVRKKKNSSGTISVQVIDKSSGKYKVVKTIGSSSILSDIEEYNKQAKAWIKGNNGILEIDFAQEIKLFENFTNSIEELQLKGLDLLIGRIFDQVGFNAIPDEIFRYLVIYRVCYPKSKLKTSEYLYRYHQINWAEDKIYRYLDKLYHTQKEKVQKVSYEHTLNILGGQISVVFYDVTTLYFEIDNEDDLRKTGFSKEGKHQNPQIVLGLLISKNGYPLAYDIFEGNKFEGHTMLPIIDAFKSKFNLDKLIVVADSGLLSNDNMRELNSKGYEFILGARIKNEKQDVQNKILSLIFKDGESAILEKGNSIKLIISYSNNRAKKDKHNREKGLKKLEKRIKTGKLTKASINNRGYNKYLKLEGKINVTIDKEKFEADTKWDGLKGYITNTNLSKADIIENYSHLWLIEKAFRISKTDLKIRPIYHRKQRRIEAHICISFVAYKLYKELERQLSEKKAGLSPEKAIEIAKTIFQIKVQTPNSKEILTKVLLLTEEQKYLANIFGF